MPAPPIVTKLFTSTFSPEKDFTRIYTDVEIEEHRQNTSSDAHETWWKDYCETRSPGLPHEPRTSSFEFSERVFDKEARLQVSRAYRGTGWSVSVRWNPPKGATFPAIPPRARFALPGTTTGEVKPNWRAQTGYGLTLPEGPFLFSIDEIVTGLSELLAGEKDSHDIGPGLISGYNSVASTGFGGSDPLWY